MNSIAIAPKLLLKPVESQEERVIRSALSGIAPTTARVYEYRMRQYLAFTDVLTRSEVRRFLANLQTKGCSPAVCNQALAAIKRLAFEAGEMDLLESSNVTQIQTIKGFKLSGKRHGQWLNSAQVRQLFASVDSTSAVGRRDAAVLALIVGCGLRRTEICNLEVDQLQEVHGRTLLVNIKGKGNKLRSVAVPDWAAQILNKWKEEL